MTRPPPPDSLPSNRNIGTTLIVVTGILTGFMLLTTVLRIYTRFSLNAQGLDDYSMIIVNILALPRMAIQVVQVTVYNNGRHRWYISESDYINNNMLGCATGFGVARAASLGLVTVDLSWDYAKSAIWSNLELFLGIIAANVAISHSIYAFLRHKKTADGEPGSNSTNIRLGYLKHVELHNDVTRGTDSAIARHPSISKSEGSEAPLAVISYTAPSSAVDSKQAHCKVS
ncbi:hypothetical protein TrVFT333_009421 [Trichoderma virens FT-333]|nr:hypothetical protein TrVFT333_009421 [Trichoderma virens FT-333]